MRVILRRSPNDSGVVLNDDFDAAFRELFLPAYAVAYRILGDRQDAEDAAAEALARMTVSWRRLQALPHRRAWVLRVTANVAIDMVRRRRPSTADAADAATPHNGVDDRLHLAVALSRLPRRQREVVVLRYLLDMTEVQVADHLSITQGAVKQHARRGLDSLRRQLSGSSEGMPLAV